MKKIGLGITLIILQLSAAVARDYRITDFGAVADAKTLNTAAIQKAIDRIAQRGGGRLIFPTGIWLTGTMRLRSGVEIHLERGATILGSPNSRDYLPLHDINERPNERKDNARLALIIASNAQDIALTGEGTIDGNGLAVALDADSLHHAGIRIDSNYNVRRKRPSELVRPKLCYFVHCRHVTISGLQVKSSAGWGLSFDFCEDLLLEKLTIVNRAYWNNDGMDIDDCRRVIIRGCNVNAADDGICLKSNHPNACNDSIVIEDCDVCSSASAVKFGTASYGGFHHIRVRNIRVRDTFRSAIALECVDGGTLEDVEVSHVTAFNTGNAIFIRLGARGGDRPGTLRDVSISHLYCEVPFTRPDIDYDLRGPEVDFFHNPFPSSITGIPGNRVHNIRLDDIEIVCPGRATKGMAYAPLSRLDDIDEQIKGYPEFSMFGELPAWGFYVRHADGLSMHNIRLRLKDSDFRPAIVLDDVLNVRMNEIMVPGGIYRNGD